MKSVINSSSSPFLFILLSWSLLLLLLSHSAVVFSLNSEGEVLISLLKNFSSFGGYNYTRLNWNNLSSSSTTPCDWEGIVCNTQKTHVVFLNLARYYISGQLGPQIGRLRYLQSLDLGSNDLNGSIPVELWNCSHLQYLDLSFNRFSGKLPVSLFQISGLKFVSLHLNNLIGSISTELWNCSHLQHLDLSVNHFTGEFPHEAMCNLYQLKTFSISHNKFSGRIPECLFQSSGLEDVGLGYNNLTGSIPVNIGNATNMKKLSLSSNQLHGVIPTSIANCSKLEFFGLFDNGGLSGELPVEMPKLHHLNWIDLSENQFFGSVPKDLGINNTDLDWVDFSNNAFTGEIPPNLCFGKQLQYMNLNLNQFHGDIPSSYTTGNCDSLTQLTLQGNNLTGSLPHFALNLFDLNLRNNNFSGTIPMNFTGPDLQYLDLNGNCLEGKIPRTLGNNSSHLRYLDLGNNQFNDTFPSFLAIIPKLEILVLRSNKLYGPLEQYYSQSRYSKLEILDISSNNLEGKLPLEFILGLDAMKKIDFNLTEEDTGIYYTSSSTVVTHKAKEMRVENTQMTTFRAIDMSNNRFQGSIPESIGELSVLTSLNLSNNNLNGRIPSSLGKLNKLESLDLSKNKLFGEIPGQLTNLNFLTILNLSYNNLTGQIPTAGQFLTYPNDSFVGNPGLCGLQSSTGCGSDAGKGSLRLDPVDDSNSWNFTWEPVAIGYGCGVLIGLVLQYFIFTKASMYRWFG